MTNRTDDFNRADSTTALGTPSDGGSAWVAGISTTWGISSNQGYSVTTVGQAVCYLDSTNASGAVQVTLATTGTDIGVVGRVADMNNYILGAWTSGSGWRIFKNVAGAFTQIGSTSAGSMSNGDVLKLDITSGNAITLYNNGASKCSGTDAAGSTNTNWGLRSHNQTTPRFDTFSFTDAASGSTGTVAKTNANDASAASGTTTVIGTLAKTNGNDASAASGTTTVLGTLAKTNANDTCAASGTVGSGVSGAVAYTNANDTSAGAGTTTVTGTLARTNANDSVSAAGWAGTITGTLAATNANDAAAASGTAAQGVQAQSSGGILPWNKSAEAKRFKEQEALRQEALEIIAKAQQSPDVELAQQAKGVSLLLQEDIERLDRQAQEYEQHLSQRATQKRMNGLMSTRNDALATRQMQRQVIDAQLKAEALVEELDVVFLAVMMAVME